VVEHFTDRPTDRVVGVLGGMGPLATADFHRRLVEATPATKDWNHLHIIVENNPRMPSRSRAFLYGELSPAPNIAVGMRRLVELGAQLIAVPCNTAAHFFADLRDELDVPIIDPVDATAAAVVESGQAAPSVLGTAVTYRAGLYDTALATRDRRTTAISDDDQAEVIEIIEALKLGRTGSAVVSRTRAVIERAAMAGADAAILGCTELGMIASQLSDCTVPVFDSMECLVARTVQLARPIVV
jgi:aspartate racemase